MEFYRLNTGDSTRADGFSAAERADAAVQHFRDAISSADAEYLECVKLGWFNISKSITKKE